MNYGNNKIFGLFKFQSGYRKFYLNSPNGYSGKIINMQTVRNQQKTNIEQETKTGNEVATKNAVKANNTSIKAEFIQNQQWQSA